MVDTIIGVVVGFLLSEIKDWCARKKRHTALWHALNAEIDFCKERASTYLQDNVMAPLYRLPVLSYINCMPVLLSDGALTENEVRPLVEFYTEVETLNRGLDNAAAMRADGDNEMLREEYDRNRLKATRLAESGVLYSKAIAVTGGRRADRCLPQFIRNLATDRRAS
ncbi:MAG: hypothetical protein ACREBU_13395 [Nitrososphaera sp.]